MAICQDRPDIDVVNLDTTSETNKNERKRNYIELVLMPLESALPTSRREAVKLGEIFYQTPYPCAYGHYAKRDTSGSCCVTCSQERRTLSPGSRVRWKWNDHNPARKEAIKVGARFYWTGVPCPYGHIADRYTTGGHCTQCLRNRREIRNSAKRPYTCLQCTSEFPRNSRGRASKFCSEDCRKIYTSLNKVKPCSYREIFNRACAKCTTMFSTTTFTKKYCSEQCSRRADRKTRRYLKPKVQKICEVCEIMFTGYSKRKYCSKVCGNRGSGRKIRSDISRYENTAKRLLKSARKRARNRNIPFNLTIKDIAVPDCCPVFGIKLQPFDHHADSFLDAVNCVPTIDRLIPKLGYVKGNIDIISYRANSLKSDGTLTEFEAITNYIRNKTIL